MPGAEVPSPSARKVWIEMSIIFRRRFPAVSPSARKVWIEIVILINSFAINPVTFRKEGVD